MDQQGKFTKRQILLGALAAALAYGLFGPVGLVIVALYFLYKWV